MQSLKEADIINHSKVLLRCLLGKEVYIICGNIGTENTNEKERSDRQMKGIDLFNAAIYMVGLHFKAEKPYTCTRTKIEKLLAIADLIAIKSGHRLFPQHQMYINSCGIGYCVLAKDALRFPMDKIIDGETLSPAFTDEPQLEIDQTRDIPELYSTSIDSEKIRLLLEDVYCSYGKYSAKLIGTTMDEFKQRIESDDLESISLKHIVDAQKAQLFFNNEKEQLLSSNRIAMYIARYQVEL